ncbi:MAG: cytochrome b561 [Bermanella sp.]|jgi:cytochrome b561
MNQFKPFQKFLHWTTGITILGLFGLGYWMRTLDYYNSWYQTAPDIHKAVGVILISVMTLRFILKITYPTPEPLATHKPWEIKSAHIVHMAMYSLILIIMASGYLISTADNRGIDVFGLFEAPSLFIAFEEQEDIAGFIHEWCAYVLMGLVAIHAGGALKHHFIDKDNTLRRML